MMVGQPPKPERLAGDLLVLDQRRGAPIHRPQRGQIRRRDAELGTQVPPEERRHNPNGLEKPPAHAQKADLQRKAELELRSSAFLDDPALVGRELEEHLDLEGRNLARQVPQAEKRSVPAVHRAPPRTAR